MDHVNWVYTNQRHHVLIPMSRRENILKGGTFQEKIVFVKRFREAISRFPEFSVAQIRIKKKSSSSDVFEVCVPKLGQI